LGAREVTIKPTAIPELGYMIDGDLYVGAGTLKVAIGPMLELVRLRSSELD
jgi:hypothetical protein